MFDESLSIFQPHGRPLLFLGLFLFHRQEWSFLNILKKYRKMKNWSFGKRLLKFGALCLLIWRHQVVLFLLWFLITFKIETLSQFHQLRDRWLFSKVRIFFSLINENKTNFLIYQTIPVYLIIWSQNSKNSTRLFSTSEAKESLTSGEFLSETSKSFFPLSSFFRIKL